MMPFLPFAQLMKKLFLLESGYQNYEWGRIGKDSAVFRVFKDANLGIRSDLISALHTKTANFIEMMGEIREYGKKGS